MATSNQQPVQHPIIRPPEEFEVPKSPVRVDEALGPTEDLDREPDGVPHAVIGYTAGFSVMLALLVGLMFLAGNTTSRVMAVLLVILAVPTVVSSLRKRAERDRDHLHPSR
jgi:hypothetical protein